MFKGRVKRKLQLIQNDRNLDLGEVEACEKSIEDIFRDQTRKNFRGHNKKTHFYSVDSPGTILLIPEEESGA